MHTTRLFSRGLVRMIGVCESVHDFHNKRSVLMARRRKTRRTRRNPIRTTGALIINPRRRKRRTTKRRTRRNALQIRKNTRRRSTRRRSTRRNTLQIRKNRRRRSTRKGMVRRTARRAYKPRRRARRRRRNGTRRGMRRKTAARAYTRRRRNGKRRSRRTYMKRRRNSRAKDMIAKLSDRLAKIPVLGGFLSFAPYAGAAALMVEPVMWLHQALGRYAPNFPAPLFYGATGLIAAGLIKILHKMVFSKMISVYTADKLAVAAASAGGAIAYYKFRSQGNTVDSVAEEMGALELRGFSGPMGLLELRGWGGTQSSMAGYGNYGDYGPAAVMPLGTY